MPRTNIFWIKHNLITLMPYVQSLVKSNSLYIGPVLANFLGGESLCGFCGLTIIFTEFHPESFKKIHLQDNMHGTLQMSLQCPGPLSLIALTLNRYSVLGVRLCISRFCCAMSRICPQSSVRTLLGGVVMIS